jgi:hypothetical protein
LVDQVKTWHTGTLNRPWGAFEAGTVYRITPNGHRCNSVFCSCDDYRRGHICKHVRAVVIAEAEQSRLDAEIDQAIADALGVTIIERLRAEFPPCMAGCGAITEGNLYCDDCGAARERAAERQERNRVLCDRLGI